MSSIALRSAYVDLLDRWTWDQFATNTFRNEVHPEKADKLWRLWISKMNRHLYGHRWDRRGGGLFWCRASELQKRGVTHFHGLIGGHGASTLDCRRWQDEWFSLAGIARMERPNSENAVQHYLVKHISRGAEIDFGGPFALDQNRRY